MSDGQWRPSAGQRPEANALWWRVELKLDAYDWSSSVVGTAVPAVRQHVRVRGVIDATDRSESGPYLTRLHFFRLKPIAPGDMASPAAAPVAVQEPPINRLFRLMVQTGASDLHLSVSVPPMVR
ncbi:MAG TPA: hypothetical protein VMF13_16300, partial [Luteitalea sp.]|nr:hypothetical protein [Luteitalea sp.]